MAGAAAFVASAAVPAPQPGFMRLCANGAARYAPSPDDDDGVGVHAPCHALRPKNDLRKSLRRAPAAE
jgi:hypothetical protein